jgi:hypothetical protein
LRKEVNFVLLKKLLAILVSVLYLTMTAGMVVSAHYCMGDLADISIGHDTAEKCRDCGMDNNGCCHDEVKICRITDAHGPAASVAVNHPAVVPAVLPASSSPQFFQLHSARFPAYMPDPPEPDGISLCIRHSVFRI